MYNVGIKICFFPLGHAVDLAPFTEKIILSHCTVVTDQGTLYTWVCYRFGREGFNVVWGLPVFLTIFHLHFLAQWPMLYEWSVNISGLIDWSELAFRQEYLKHLGSG